MSERRDDDFHIRPSAPKNRGQGFVSKVLKQAGKANSGKSSVRRPASARGTGQRPGSRLGRGHTAARFAGAKLTPMSRRVNIKTLLVNQRQASPRSLAKHLRYIERDGVGRDCRERMREANAEGKTKGRGTGPRRKPVCTWGWRGTERLCRRAALSARPAPMQACSRASHDGTRHGSQGERP